MAYIGYRDQALKLIISNHNTMISKLKKIKIFKCEKNNFFSLIWIFRIFYLHLFVQQTNQRRRSHSIDINYYIGYRYHALKLIISNHNTMISKLKKIKIFKCEKNNIFSLIWIFRIFYLHLFVQQTHQRRRSHSIDTSLTLFLFL